jgi:hypothetical protein
MPRASSLASQPLGELLAELGDLGRDDDRAIRLARIPGEVFLVISLRLVERRGIGSERTASAILRCSGDWAKITERYCVPTSLPWRSLVVGS